MSWDRYLANVVTLDYDEEKCIGCEMCVQVCAREVFEMVDKKARVVRRDNCIECGACAKNCLGNAIRVRAGVGCAAGIIKEALGIRDDCCCVLNKEDCE
jgi:NAD-dependent dihydropyrimidine dehydrogenase PreA subunit